LFEGNRVLDKVRKIVQERMTAKDLLKGIAYKVKREKRRTTGILARGKRKIGNQVTRY